jgi:hypothetical protein
VEGRAESVEVKVFQEEKEEERNEGRSQGW